MSVEQFLLTPSYPPLPAIALNALLAFILTLVIMPLIKDRLENLKLSLKHLLSVVVFCVLAMIAGLTFAGERRNQGTNPPTNKDSMQICSEDKSFPSDWRDTGCMRANDACPATQDGGSCQETSAYQYRPYGNTSGYRQWFNFTAYFDYCPDSAPHFDGTKCVASQPNQCAAQEGKTTSQGFYDFGEMAGVEPSVTNSGLKVGCDMATKCVAFWTGNDVSHTSLVDGKKHYFAKGAYQYDGVSCDTSKDKPINGGSSLLPANSCGPGKRMGQVNGRDVCVNVGPPSPPGTPGKEPSVGPNGPDIPKNPAAPPLPPGCWRNEATNWDIYCLDTVQGIGVVGGTSGAPADDKGAKEGDTNGDGTSTDPEAKSCGGPGQPKCNVKIDESGVDPNKGKLDAEKTSFANAIDSVKAEFEKYKNGGTWGITWSYQLPTGTCSALQIGAGKYVAQLDVCKPLGYVRDLWAYVLYMLTALYIWRSARDAMNII